MGFLKIFFFIATPVGGMSIAAFSLGKQLPKACRLFGNYIGLSYIYFKSIIKILKPQDHMTYQMIDIARKASQQSQALKRQLKNTVKKMKLQVKQKRDEVFKQFQNEFPILKDQQSDNNQTKGMLNAQLTNSNNKVDIMKNKTAGDMIVEMQRKRKQVIEGRTEKKRANKFFEEV